MYGMVSFSAQERRFPDVAALNTALAANIAAALEEGLAAVAQRAWSCPAAIRRRRCSMNCQISIWMNESG